MIYLVIPLSNSGKNMDTGSINVKTNNSTIKTIVNGSVDFATFSNDNPLIALATFKLSPTGGVRKPISAAKIIIIPKCTGCIPNSVTTAKRIGASKIMPAIVSIKIPININKRTIKLKITQKLTGKDTRKSVIFTGILSTVKILAYVDAVAIIIKMIPEIKVVLLNNSIVSFHLISLKINLRNAQYATATPASSVAVKIPP